MNRRQAMELVHAVEAALPVDTWYVDGVPLWPILRVQLGFVLHAAASSSSSTSSLRGGARVRDGIGLLSRALEGRRRHRAAARKDTAHHAKSTSRVDVAFLTHTTCRTFRLPDGRWYDTFCQPVLELLEARGHSSFVFEYAPADEYRIPRANPSRFIEPALTSRRFLNDVTPVRRGALDGEAALRSMLGAHTDVGELLRLGIKRARLVHKMSKYFRELLRDLSPRIAFVVNYYDARCMAFILACRQLGVRTLDIQHGVQGELHVAYGDWRRVPPGGYAVLPSIFWCWSDADARRLHAWTEGTSGAHDAVVGGNLILTRFLDGSSALVRELDARLAPQVAGVERNVLVTLQPGRQLPSFVRRAIEHAPADWRWWVRLHPAMMAERARVKDEFAALGRERVVVDEATDLPLYSLLRHMDAHVTELSSTVLEARQFAVPSLLCGPAGAELYGDLLAQGAAAVVDGEAELLDLLARSRARTAPVRPPLAMDADGLDRLVGARS